MNPLISIIVPVYNCEKRIAIFHQSVSNQTFNDFEVIYVDDSSTDSSLDLLNKIKSQEKNVEVKSHLKNLGAGDARNTGLNISRGKYLCFLDADDYIEVYARTGTSSATAYSSGTQMRFGGFKIIT